MRLLIESHNRWVFELTTTNHHAVACSTRIREPTFALQSSVSDTVARSTESKTFASSTEKKDLICGQADEPKRTTAISRHKSIRKRLGRIFLHFRRSETNCGRDTYAYINKGGVAELPNEQNITASSPTVQEMPTSFTTGRTFELEQPQIYNSNSYPHMMGSSYEQSSFQVPQSHYKTDYSGDLNVFAGALQVTTPQQPPRLAIPGPLQDLPTMITDQSPHSASTLSPNTPRGHYSNTTHPHLSAQQNPPMISPCDISSESNCHLRETAYEYQGLYNLRSPMAISPADVSYATTPVSAYPLSTRTSFGVWPQPVPEYLQSAFPQRYHPMNSELDTHTLSGPRLTAWTADLNMHPQQYQCSPSDKRSEMKALDSLLDIGKPFTSSSHQKSPAEVNSAYSEIQLLPAIHICDTSTDTCHEDNEAPPAYSLPAATPQQYPPATCQHCGNSYRGKFGKANLRRHVEQKHESVLDRVIHTCRVCLKKYNRADALKKHRWKKHRHEDARPNKRRGL